MPLGSEQKRHKWGADAGKTPISARRGSGCIAPGKRAEGAQVGADASGTPIGASRGRRGNAIEKRAKEAQVGRGHRRNTNKRQPRQWVHCHREASKRGRSGSRTHFYTGPEGHEAKRRHFYIGLEGHEAYSAEGALPLGSEQKRHKWGADAGETSKSASHGRGCIATGQ